MNINYKSVIALGGVILVLTYVIKTQAGRAINSTVNAIDPTNQENAFATFSNKIGDAVANDGNKKPLGIRIYDFFH